LSSFPDRGEKYLNTDLSDDMKSKLIFDSVLIRYGEIGLKGKNRSIFEKKLVENIKFHMKKRGIKYKKIERVIGRIIIYGRYELDDIIHLKNVFGIVSFSPAIKTEATKNLKKITEISLKLAKENKTENFKIETQRLDKTFPLNSMQINEKVGKIVCKRTGMKVKLDNPGLTIGIEIIKKGKKCSAYIFKDRIAGYVGLPVGIEGKVVCLISGGIDSPVAAWMMMKRGCAVILLHLYNYPFTDERTKNKAIKLYEKLKEFGNTKLYIIPYGTIQLEISKLKEKKLRCILCRRMMLRIAEHIAKKENAKAIVTGESLGQVASQTLINIQVENNATELPILRPLIGLDKIEIIEIAKKIGTYEISTMPSFCCKLVPQHPSTRAKADEIKKVEKKLDIKNLISKSIKKAELKF